MVTLARNLDILGSRFLTGLSAIFLTRLRKAPAWKVRTLVLITGRHNGSPFQDCGSELPWRKLLPTFVSSTSRSMYRRRVPLQTLLQPLTPGFVGGVESS